MVEKMKELGIIYESDGAMVVDVEEPEDATKINPCMVLKTGGVSCYQTTDLATIMQREKDFKPNAIIYVVDKRQELHFVQVFRCARKAQIINKDADGNIIEPSYYYDLISFLKNTFSIDKLTSYTVQENE